MMNAILKFPASEDAKKKTALAGDIRPDPVLRAFSRDDSHALLGVAQRVHRGIGILLDLVDSHREMAHEAGVETVTIELGAERKNVERALDTLEESELKQSSAQLSLEGLELLRRSEKLLAEAESNISRFMKHVPPKSLGQAASKMPSSDALLWGSIAVFGGMVVMVAVLVISSSSSEKDPR